MTPFAVVRTFPGYGAMVHLLSDGQAHPHAQLTGPTTPTSVGGYFVRYLSDDEAALAAVTWKHCGV